MSKYIEFAATPNGITLLRILIIPLIVIFMAMGMAWSNWVALVLYTVACITDWLDGYLARHSSLSSLMGGVIDPIADKVLTTVLSFMLVWLDVDSSIVIPIMITVSRDIMVSGLRQLYVEENLSFKTTFAAKLKTVCFMIGIGFLISWHEPWGWPTILIGSVFLWAAMFLALWSAFAYFRDYLNNSKSAA